MIRFEDSDLEKSVLKGESCIAVPIEIFKSADGEIYVLTYSFCKEPAEKFIEKFKDDVFSNRAIEWINNVFGEIMNDLGYDHYSHEGEMMLEYVMKDKSELKIKPDIVPQIITTNEELEMLCENTGCSIELEDDDDFLYAVVENGIILSYAGMNSLQYADGSVEISVETAPDRHREGYGIACVTALTSHLLGKGKTVRYKCSLFNKPSSALAEKCGFSLEGKRYSYICGIHEDN